MLLVPMAAASNAEPLDNPHPVVATVAGSAQETPGPVAESAPSTIVDRTASPQLLDVAQPAESGGLPTGTIMLAALALAVVVLVGAGVLIVVRRRTRGGKEQPYVVKKPPEPKPVRK